ncbi:MAG: CapA family protein [Clostridia bacterium]|nr:CapA family protein [Clostridia bacterium]
MTKRFIIVIAFILLAAIPVACCQADEEYSLGGIIYATSDEEDVSTGLEDTASDDPASSLAIVTPSAASFETEPDGSVIITVTATGDVTIGSNYKSSGKSIFVKELERQKNDINFAFKNFKDVFEADDLTLINFEGTLTTVARPPANKMNNDFLFRAPPEYVALLSNNSVEAVTLENNHANDFGAEGLAETKRTLTAAGVVYTCEGEIGVVTVKGVQVALLAYQTFDAYDRLFTQVPLEVAAAKARYPLVIVSFHWGRELDYKPNANQQRLGKSAIDAGADLVLGHHSHRINPIEEYNDKYIVYSLGNFSFAGNIKPSDMSTFVFQARFRVKDDIVTGEGFRIIPARISSRTDTNDFTPTPYDKQVNIDSLLSVLQKNGASLTNPVSEYPLVFPE